MSCDMGMPGAFERCIQGACILTMRKRSKYPQPRSDKEWIGIQTAQDNSVKAMQAEQFSTNNEIISNSHEQKGSIKQRIG
eukprot:1154097-Pelagomonas_calceolata.AAC.2